AGGVTDSSNWPTVNPHQGVFAGGVDGTVTKFTLRSARQARHPKRSTAIPPADLLSLLIRSTRVRDLINAAPSLERPSLGSPVRTRTGPPAQCHTQAKCCSYRRVTAYVDL